MRSVMPACPDGFPAQITAVAPLLTIPDFTAARFASLIIASVFLIKVSGTGICPTQDLTAAVCVYGVSRL